MLVLTKTIFRVLNFVVKVESSDNLIKLDLTYGQVGYRNAKGQQTNQIATFKKLQIMQIKGLHACARLAEHILEQKKFIVSTSDLSCNFAEMSTNISSN